MSLEQLQVPQQPAEDFNSIPPSQYEELAESCSQLAVNRLDTRFTVLSDCLRLTTGFWGPSEAGAVTTAFAAALGRTWTAYLPGILRGPSEEEGAAVAAALREELVVLGGSDPLAYQSPPDRSPAPPSSDV